ncbi:MAG: hypothetical protein J3K34DRAFT_392353, partial [Monoraphidium minutum]
MAKLIVAAILCLAIAGQALAQERVFAQQGCIERVPRAVSAGQRTRQQDARSPAGRRATRGGTTDLPWRCRRAGGPFRVMVPQELRGRLAPRNGWGTPARGAAPRPRAAGKHVPGIGTAAPAAQPRAAPPPRRRRPPPPAHPRAADRAPARPTSQPIDLMATPGIRTINIAWNAPNGDAC